MVPRLAFALSLLFSPAAARAADEARFFSYPDIRGDRLVFAWEADLYTVPADGGTAVRLTHHPGGELAPKFSPDGKWIAYSTFNDGVFDVWAMAADGGTPTRLTWPPLGGQVVAWTPDSRHVVFRSRWGVPPAARDQKLYNVGLDAAMPEALPIDRGQSISFSGDGQKALYVRKGNEDYYWKRYKGGQYPDIWMADFAAKTLETPLARPDVDVQEGDYLLAIDGQPVRVPENYFRLLQVGKSSELWLTVARGPKDPAPRTYRVRPAKSDREARYARWVTDNVDKVLKLSNGDVGYMHVTAMGGRGIMEFDKFWRAFRYKKGLVVDVRGNSGGWTEYFMIDKLERQQVAFNVLKGMEPYRYPNPASRAHFLLVSNEDNGSDGEAFVEHFKARKLGTVVGVPSWGGLVGVVNGQRTIDNGRVEQSNNAFYGREGKWLVENHGADPDVLQDNDPASVMAGRDLQLEKAVEVALQKIKEQS